MRRGLISRSKAELPDAVLDARIARVRAAMGEAGLDALLLYTNNTRAAGVSWLTGFVPYWSEALLVVLRDREPVLVAALSYRVKSWIERTSRVAEVVHGPRIGFEAASVIAALKADAALCAAARRGRSGGDRVGDEGDGNRAARAGRGAGARGKPGRNHRRGRSASAQRRGGGGLYRRRPRSRPRPSPQAHRGRGGVGRKLRATRHCCLQGHV